MTGSTKVFQGQRAPGQCENTWGCQGRTLTDLHLSGNTVCKGNYSSKLCLVRFAFYVSGRVHDCFPTGPAVLQSARACAIASAAQGHSKCSPSFWFLFAQEPYPLPAQFEWWTCDLDFKSSTFVTPKPFFLGAWMESVPLRNHKWGETKFRWVAAGRHEVMSMMPKSFRKFIPCWRRITWKTMMLGLLASEGKLFNPPTKELSDSILIE